MVFKVYLIQHDHKSYIGYTNDHEHRFRQHRKEIKGGAKYTSSWDKVTEIAYVSGFGTNKSKDLKAYNLSKKMAMSYEFWSKRQRGVPMGMDKNKKVPKKYLKAIISKKTKKPTKRYKTINCKKVSTKFPIKGIPTGLNYRFWNMVHISNWERFSDYNLILHVRKDLFESDKFINLCKRLGNFKEILLHET